MKKILGLDIGTNSIGWAMIERDLENGNGRILGMGCRIIPTDTELLSKYETGQAASKNAARRQARGARRLRQRYKLRRDRLIESLKILGWLPADFQPGFQLPISDQTLEEMRKAFGTAEISDDWVIYFLRHKALREPISAGELARILYHMNQRRGFKSNRKTGQDAAGEDEEETGGKKKRSKTVEIVAVRSVQDTGEKLKGNNVFTITLSDGRSGTIARKLKPDWEGKELELEITWIPPTRKDKERLEFRPLNNTDADKWAKQKVAREVAIRRSGHLFPGNYYYHEIKTNPGFVIKDVSIDRQFYIDELTAILKKQIELNPSLNNPQKIAAIAQTLYPKNLDKQKEIASNDLVHLFIKDIIYYQRPLKSKKSSIADCRLATKNYRDPVTGKALPHKAAPLSSPVFQEFRIWQTVNNIRILQRETTDVNGSPVFEKDVSDQYITVEMREKLFELFDGKDKVTQKQILKLFGLGEEDYLVNLYRQNEEKELPGNETKALIRRQFKKASYEEAGNALINDPEKFYLLWHILYSLEEDTHIQHALEKQFGIEADISVVISKAPPFKQQYGSLSHQAMSRLLPLMRSGKYWKWDAIDPVTQERLDKLFTGEFDEGISDRVRDLFKKYEITNSEACQGFMVPMASYAVYGVHSEKNTAHYDKPEQLILKDPLNLRNPIVEQVVNETLRLVHDIWKNEKLGRPYRIHIELARELKKNAEERKEITETMTANENENKRIAAILRELKLGNPQSLADIERLKLWERQADEKAREELKNIRFKKPSEPTKDEIAKYKLWAKQKFLSPYTGNPIPINELFSRSYDIDHIIPRSRLFDDSLENKVVVETDLNNEKGNRTAFEFIKAGSKKKKLLSPAQYQEHVSKYFFGKKKKLLLSEDVPDSFTNRHLVDSRYISRKLHELLSPVSEEQRDPVIATTGKITGELRSAWGLGEKMKQLVKWRFERLQEKTEQSWVWYEDKLDESGAPTGESILRLKGYEKRIDHRHHPLDALVIACTTRSHIKYLNDLNAVQYRKQTNDDELKQYLPKLLEEGKGNYLQSRKFRKPWPSFVKDSMLALSGVIISFKNQIRLFGKKANKNWRYIKQPDGTFKKMLKPVVDESGQRKLSPYVRQSLHKATIAGRIQLREYKQGSVNEAFQNPMLIANKDEKKHIVGVLEMTGNDLKKALKLYKENPLKDESGLPLKKITMIQMAPYFVNRVDIMSGFDEKRLNKIPDKKLRKALEDHIIEIEQLNASRDKEEQIDPFSAEGIELFNKKRTKPVSKVRIKEESESKFEIRPGAFTEADKGTNLFFIIYENIENPADRKFESIPLRTVIEAKAAGSGFVEERPGYRWFSLSPNDLVYVPDEGEQLSSIDWTNTQNLSSKIYKMVSCNKAQAFFVPHTVSKVIADKIEFDSMNKVERGLDQRMIKQHCIKLKCDRLGNISPVFK